MTTKTLTMKSHTQPSYVFLQICALLARLIDRSFQKACAWLEDFSLRLDRNEVSVGECVKIASFGALIAFVCIQMGIL